MCLLGLLPSVWLSACLLPCLPTCSRIWMEGGQVWLHLPLPVFHRAPQTSLSFICQQQPVIKIPLPEGPRGKQMWLTEAAGRLVFQLLLYIRYSPHILSMTWLPCTRLHTNSVFLHGLTEVSVRIYRHMQALTVFDKRISPTHLSWMPL